MDTDDMTVLLIANEGERLIPIGRWENPVTRLVASKHLAPTPSPGDPTGMFNCVITALGREAVKAYEGEEDKALGNMITHSSEVGTAQVECRRCIEEAVKLIAKASLLSAKVTGDSATTAAKSWLDIVENEVLQQVK